MNLYQRRELVEANPTEDDTHMLVFPISSEISKDGLITIPTPYLIPMEFFRQNYEIVPQLSGKDFAMNDQVADFIKAPLVGFDATAASSASAASDGFAAAPDYAAAFAAGRPIIDLIINRIPDTIQQFPNFISLELLLWGAEVAFNFGIGKLPFPIPEIIKTQLWNQLEAAIRAIWQNVNPTPA